jgi:ATP/maltotriose-dependent transcriptional regulator MalT
MCVAGLGAAACALGRPADAGRLLGCAEKLLEDLGAPLDPVDRAVFERSLATVRQELGRSRSECELSIGRTLAVEDALEIAESLTTRPSSPTDGSTAILSAREREVVGLVVLGYTNRQIADALVISERTANTHVQHVM